MFGKLPVKQKLEKLRDALLEKVARRSQVEKKTVSDFLAKIEKDYENHSFARNRIAHSNCKGVKRSDPDYVLFWTYKKVGENQLAVDAVSIQEMERATNWGRTITDMALRLEEVLSAES
jgi:hypothetical protein